MIFTLILPALVEEPPLEISPWIYPTRVSFDQINPDTTCTYISRVAKILSSILLKTRTHFGQGNIEMRSFHFEDWEPSASQSKALHLSLLSFTQSWPRNKGQCDLNITSDFTKYPRDAVVDDSLNPKCSCDIGTQQCPANSFSPPVKEKQVGNNKKFQCKCHQEI